MKKFIPILLMLTGILHAKPSSDAVNLVSAMRLPERYSKQYGAYNSYGSISQLSKDSVEALPPELRTSGLQARFAEHIDQSLTENEIKEALKFYNSTAGRKLTSATFLNEKNFSSLDMIATGWASQRSDKVREILHLQKSGGEEAKPYVMNLRQIVTACDQYMLEEGKKKAAHSDVVGTYIKKIKPINGESYKDIVVTAGGGKVSVKNQDGAVFEYTY